MRQRVRFQSVRVPRRTHCVWLCGSKLAWALMACSDATAVSDRYAVSQCLLFPRHGRVTKRS